MNISKSNPPQQLDANATDATGATKVLNALSFDIEDYFQVSNFEAQVSRDRWDDFESRVERNTRIILEILAAHEVKATFFVLGWVAEKFPGLVREIVDTGHELGTHGHLHRLIYTLEREEFRSDLRRSIDILEQASGKKVLGHRAPSFSITRKSLWALDILQEEGLSYDSSVFPVHHPRYGIASAPRAPYEIVPGFLEFPMSVWRVGPMNVPIAGGGYFRLYPYSFTRMGMRRINRKGVPTVVYLHPWEFDPDQPRMQASLQARFRHYVNLHRTASRLDRLCRDFRFAPLSTVLGISA